MSELILEQRDRETRQENGPEERDQLLGRVLEFADQTAHRPNLGLQTAPKRELEQFARMGLLSAPLPLSEGGLALGSEPGTQLTLMRIFAAIGGADLALGRIYEGHVNGVLLVLHYGSKEQIEELAEDIRAGMISGVWNTGRPELLRLIPDTTEYHFQGEKTFATGAAFVRRPVVTAEIPGRGWQMTLPRMETLGASIDRSFWHPLGMESSESFGIDFTGGKVSLDQLIGSPGDFYKDPIFRGGAIRFAAVQAGAVIRLHQMFAEWLEESRRGEDPYQVARLGEIAIAAQEAAMWVEKAALVAEKCFYKTDKTSTKRMIECANMMRIAIERLGTGVMQRVTAGVGAHGLLQPARFERVIRDLTMYLRQPAPDQTLAAIGKASLEEVSKRGTEAFWSDAGREESLSPGYFRRIYAQKGDPWEFETSEYEHKKYAATLAALPREKYETGVEVGCSIGVLTRLLAERCDRLLGLDVSDRALEQARERCEDLEAVSFERVRVPQEMPEGDFDLIVVSEVAYYWTAGDLQRAADGLAKRHVVGGHLVLVHLTEKVPDYPQSGDEVHEAWLARPEWKHVSGSKQDRYRIDVLERVGSSAE